MADDRTLSDIFAPGSTALAEGFSTLVVTPERFVAPATTVHARVTFTNVAGAPARGVRIRFSLPPGLKYVDGSTKFDDVRAPGDAADATSSAGIDIGEVAPGAVRRISLEYAVDAIVEDGTPIDIQAALASSDMPVTASNVVRLTVASRPHLSGASSLALTCSGDVVPNAELAITAAVANEGQSSAHDVVLILPIPDHTEFVADSAYVDGAPFATANRSTPFGPSDPPVVASRLAPGAGVTLSYRVRVDSPLEDGTIITATGSVAARNVREFALAPASLTVTSPLELDPEQTRFEILAADGSPPKTVTPGQRLGLRLTVRNTGQSVAHELAGTIILPSSLLYAFGSLTLDGQPYPDPACTPVTCAFGELAPGATTTMMLEATVASPLPDGRVLKADAQVRSLQRELRRFERSLTIASQPRFESARNALSAAGPRRIAPGSDVSYALTLINTGTVATSEAVLRITHDPSLEALSISEGGERRAFSDGALTIGVLAPQTPRNFTIVARTAKPQSDGTQLRLGARLTFADAPDVALGEQQHVIRSRPRFDASSSRLTTADPALRYDRLTTVAVELANEGDDVARDVVVVLRLPEELELDAPDALARDGNALSFGDLAAGVTQTVSIGVRLRKRMSLGTAVLFDGYVRAYGSAPFPLEPIALTVDARPACSGASLVCEPRETVVPGSQLAYTLSLRNSGDGSARHVALTVRASDATRFLPGSMSINGATLHDGIALSLFSSEGGLELRDVAPEVDVVVAWSTTVADPLAAGTILEAHAAVSLDGTPLPAASSRVTVKAVPAFAGAALALPFSVVALKGVAADPPSIAPAVFAGTPAPPLPGARASTAAPPRGKRTASLPHMRLRTSDWAPAPLQPAAGEVAPRGDGVVRTHDDGQVAFRLTLTAEWLVRALRFSRDVGNSPGFLRHLFAIRLFFPDGAVAGSRSLQAAFNAQRSALRSNQERLALRLRQPHITLEAADLEHADSRVMSTALFSALRASPEGGIDQTPRPPGSLALSGSLACKTAGTLADQLAQAPLGCASLWLALAHLVGTAVSEHDNGAAGAYRAALLSALSSFEAMTPVRFQRALVTQSDEALDEMLDRFLRSTALAGPPRTPDVALSR